MVASKLLGAVGAGLAVSLLVAGAAAAQQGQHGQQHGQVFGPGAPASVDKLPASAFRDALLALAPQARARAMATLRLGTTPAADLAYMRVDRQGGVFYVDPAPEQAEPEAMAAPTPPTEALAETEVFKLHSKPGAAVVLYIDFDGHLLVDTAWNTYSGQPELDMPPFSLDLDYDSFSATELAMIAESWRRVAEDFADFDVDVTTEEPAFTINPTDGRIEYAANVGHNVITRQQDRNGYWVYTQGGCGCGGVAYLNAFGNSYKQPSLTFNKDLGSTAQTIAHETGHNLGLSHDGTSSSSYYRGHGSHETGWGPIMGAPFGMALVTWSRDEYPDANNPEDDYAVINRYIPLRTDDHEDVLFAKATPLQITDGVDVVSTTRVTDPAWTDLANKGIIEDPNDYDLFSMSVGAGRIDLEVHPANRENFQGEDGADVDIQATLLDSAGNVLQTSDPSKRVAAHIAHTVKAPGDYYLEITGVGRAGTGHDYGHADYCATGQYYISGTVPPQIDLAQPPVAPDAVTAELVGDSTIELSWTDPITAPEANEAGYRVYRSVDGGAFGQYANLPKDSEFFADNNLPNGTYSYYVEVYNSADSDTTAPTDPIVIDAPAVAVAAGESTALGSVVSGSYASTQVVAGSETLSEQHSSGNPKTRKSSLDHTWTVTGVQPGAIVELELVAAAPANGEFDDFAFSYSTDGGTTWAPIGVLVNGTGEAAYKAALPANTSGTVRVRVQDTDRTTGAKTTDTVSVSLIKVTSIGDAGDMPPTVSITEPEDGFTVPGGAPVTLIGDAYDDEDVGLSADSISWSSDIDQSLGTGASLSVILSGGTPAVTHVITASTTDSAGQTATATITVIVDDSAATAAVSISGLAGSVATGGMDGM